MEQVTVTEPIEGDVALTVHPTQLGGTRLLSAAQFVQGDIVEDIRSALSRAGLRPERLVVEIWSSIREQRRFDSLEQLVAAIGGDVERTRTAVRPG